MTEPIHILSLGGGVQSSTLALMAAHGEVTPMPKAAIFADTHAEPQSVYRWLAWLEKQLPFPVHRVTAGSLTEEITKLHINQTTGRPYYANMIPAFAAKADGGKAVVGRHCTSQFKIKPLLKAQRAFANIQRGQKRVGVVCWIGISLDEVSRMKPSREPWCENRWPLVDLRMTRWDCIRWLERNGYPQPPKSACVYCPFHSDAEWRRLKYEEPEAFAEAVRVEREMQKCNSSVREGAKISLPYLHDTLKPLDQVDFSTDEDHGQQILFNQECEGMCGI